MDKKKLSLQWETFRYEIKDKAKILYGVHCSCPVSADLQPGGEDRMRFIKLLICITAETASFVTTISHSSQHSPVREGQELGIGESNDS